MFRRLLPPLEGAIGGVGGTGGTEVEGVVGAASSFFVVLADGVGVSISFQLLMEKNPPILLTTYV